MKISFLSAALFGCSAVLLHGQAAPIVQPGTPGQESHRITAAAATPPLREPSAADVSFMQGMIMHHGQAVQMTELLKTRSQNPDVQELGRKISISQTDEMKYMKRWLEDRNKPLTAGMDMGNMAGMDMSHMDHAHMQMDMPMMPGMLTPAQMKALTAATGAEFDRLFLTGMIQHHTGALTMVADLFATPGAGQDPQLFDFATDVDNTQTAEIRIMKSILKKDFPETGSSVPGSKETK